MFHSTISTKQIDFSYAYKGTEDFNKPQYR